MRMLVERGVKWVADQVPNATDTGIFVPNLAEVNFLIEPDSVSAVALR
jgi:hypothetical protein